MRICRAATLLLLIAARPMYPQVQTGEAVGPGTHPAGIVLTPIRVVLTAKAPTALLSLRNGKPEPSRFQVNAFAWSEGAAGEVLLAPTEDIIFFPPLLTLQPGEERKIRIGSTIPFAAVEKSYRLVVQELPPLEKPDGERSGILTLMKYSLPVFLEPSRMIAQARVEGMALHDRKLAFRIENRGNSHLLFKNISIKGSAKSGEFVFERQMAGWYVLAGDSRSYEIELLPEECNKTNELTVLANDDARSSPWISHLNVPANSCGTETASTPSAEKSAR